MSFGLLCIVFCIAYSVIACALVYQIAPGLSASGHKEKAPDYREKVLIRPFSQERISAGTLRVLTVQMELDIMTAKSE